MNLFLAALLLSQLPFPVPPAMQPAPQPAVAEPVRAGPAAERRDLEFQDAVEQFVRVARPGARPPEPFRSLLVRLGDPCFRCRDRAGAELLAASRSDLRWLMWGRHDRDPEIRLRCTNLLRDLTRCGKCDGSGTCRHFVGANPEQQPDYGACQNCGQWPWTHDPIGGECFACSGRGSGWSKGAFE